MTQEVVLEIKGLNKKGRGVAHLETHKAEVLGALPGDTVKVKLGRKKRKVYQADLLEVQAPSSDRIPFQCIHAPLCGGCTFQQMKYESQLALKQKKIEELFDEKPRPILAAHSLWRYRNKMEFTFSQNKKGEKFLGLVLAGTRGHVFHLTECHLAPSWMARLLCQVRLFWDSSSLQAYRMDDTGSLRTITMREGRHTGDKLVMLTVSGNPQFAISKAQVKEFVDLVTSLFSERERSQLSIFLRIQQIAKGRETQFFELHLFGKDHLQEELHFSSAKLHLKISPTSFFQPNTNQAEILYGSALNLVSFPKKHVLDLYAGTATLGLACALKADKVTSIEINPHACFDAEANKELNSLNNLEIVCGDVTKVLSELSLRPDFVPPDLIVIDPPRSGLGPKALELLKTLNAPEILYISCNPTTQALEVKELVSFGYEVKAIQPVDQFPHTLHIENIVMLSIHKLIEESGVWQGGVPDFLSRANPHCS